MNETAKIDATHSSGLTLDDLAPHSGKGLTVASGAGTEAATTDWHAVAEALYDRNRDLHREVAHLQHALAEARERAEVSAAQSQQTEERSARHTEELNAAYEQNLEISEDLRAALELIQKQQTLIEECGQQLDAFRIRTQQLENECASACDELRLAGERDATEAAEIADLRQRLEQQRHYTRQFKTALDSYLVAAGKLAPARNAEEFVAKRISEIHPWSPEATSLDETENEHVDPPVGSWARPSDDVSDRAPEPLTGPLRDDNNVDIADSAETIPRNGASASTSTAAEAAAVAAKRKKLDLFDFARS
ncbi:hypothetical protein [Rubidibacter lacunae]|nr:hypothetical protein [Rubidibacter lacunae]